MKNLIKLSFIALLMCAISVPSNAQLFNKIKRVNDKVKTEKYRQDQKNETERKQKAITDKPAENNGKTFYVSLSGSNRNSGEKSAPIKDLQKAIDLAQNGDVILVSEGNYLGKLNQGFIEITNKYISIIGGYNADFSERNPAKYLTTIRPTHENSGTCSTRGTIHMDVKGNANGQVVVDGFVLERGLMNHYCKPLPNEGATSTPSDKFETGRIITPDVQLSPRLLMPTGFTASEPLFRGRLEGHLTIKNCVFANCGNYGIMIAVSPTGTVDITNNLFVCNLYAACQVTGNPVKQEYCHVNFSYNTVLFSWCRTKQMTDMGYGFRYMTGINSMVKNNIFGCSNLSALDRGYVSSDKNHEATRVTSAVNNMFFMNGADITLPSGGGLWLKVAAEQFEDVEQLKEYEGNKQLPQSETKFINAINQEYLKGFASITISNKSNHNPNSAANQFNKAFGLNQQGSETTRVSMFGNRYPYNDIFKLWGAVQGYGAQMPK